METREEYETIRVVEEFADFADLPELIASHGNANWVVRQIKQEQAEIEKINGQLADEIDRLHRRALELAEARQNRVNWLMEKYEAALEQFAAKELEGQKTRSITLLEGTIGFRKNPASIDITDPVAALAWAKTNLPEAVKVVESVQKSPLKKHIEETGEVVKGVDFKSGFDKFYIK